MTEFLSILGSAILKVGIVALLANEIRGFVLAAPVLYGMYLSGGALMAMWIGLCSLGGIAISVVAPYWFARRFNLIPARVGR